MVGESKITPSSTPYLPENEPIPVGKPFKNTDIFLITDDGKEALQLEVIVRNIAAGSFSKRYGVEEGVVFDSPTIEFSYKNDELGDPLLDEYHALALHLATFEEIETIKKYSFTVNEQLKAFWRECGVTLVDFKLEFGRLSDGSIVLADEISPDTCRLWDSKTGEKLDKDRFRRDLGGVEDAYAEVMKRLTAHI